MQKGSVEIKDRLCYVFKGSNRSRDTKTEVSTGITHTDRRLHQMMLEDGDYERYDKDGMDVKPRPMVSVVTWLQVDYSVVTIRCKDRPKLLFDTVCTLTDMQYVVFHGSVDTEGPEAYQVPHCNILPLIPIFKYRHVTFCLLVIPWSSRSITSGILRGHLSTQRPRGSELSYVLKQR